MLHESVQFWFHILESSGYWGIIFLMALESSVFPVPSELVMVPAAFWATQGRLSLSGVILAGTVGSYLGSWLSYWGAYFLGRPLILKYGKYFLISVQKFESAETWLMRFGAWGIFMARFLPVVRHLISIPAGIFRMPMQKFTLATVLGSGLWCSVLSWFGVRVLGSNPELLESPEQMMQVVRTQMYWLIGALIGFMVLYVYVLYVTRKR